MQTFKRLLPFLTTIFIVSFYSLSVFFLQPMAFAHSSECADFLFELGKDFYEQGDYRQALDQLEKALIAEPGHPQALMYVQIIADELGFTGEKEQPTTIEYAVDAGTEPTADEELLSVELELAELEKTEDLAVVQEAEEGIKTGEYILGAGDIVEVTVWHHDELSKTVTIRPDGRISLVLIGEVEASGLTANELSQVLSSRLRKFIKGPQVTVIVNEFSSKNILVLGAVNRPGIYNISGPLTALQAIARAGGYKKYAGLKSTMIVRKPYSDTPEISSADLWSVISEGQFNNDVMLRNGDIVYVPKTFLGKVGDFFLLFNSTVKPAADTYLYYRFVD